MNLLAEVQSTRYKLITEFFLKVFAKFEFFFYMSHKNSSLTNWKSKNDASLFEKTKTSSIIRGVKQQSRSSRIVALTSSHGSANEQQNEPVCDTNTAACCCCDIYHICCFLFDIWLGLSLALF